MKKARRELDGCASNRTTMPDEFVAPLLSALRDLYLWLRASRVPGMVIGGVAVSLLGRPRATRDIDAVVWLESERWKGFLEASEEHGFVPRVKNVLEFARQNRVLLMHHRPSRIDIDISFGALPFEKEAIQRAVEKRIRGVPIVLPTPEDLTIMKAVAHRPRDLADIEAILDAHPDLNLKRVRRWLREFATALEMPELLDDIERLVRRHRKK